MGENAVLLTGATSGLGRWLAPRLGTAGLTVLLHGRDAEKVERGVAEVRAAGGQAEGHVADLASLAECDRLVAEVGGRGDLAAVVNNAGVGFGRPGQPREESRDGHELRWAVNYLAAVAVTRGLLPALVAHAPARVVNVGSLGQHPIDFDDVELTEAYDGVTAYRRAKLALAAWTFDLAEEVADTDVVVNCVHPATFMDTDMVRESGVRPASTVEEGGTAVLRLIIEDTGTGEFYDGDRTVRAHRDAYNRAVRSSLRRVTDDALR